MYYSGLWGEGVSGRQLGKGLSHLPCSLNPRAGVGRAGKKDICRLLPPEQESELGWGGVGG